MSSRGYTYKEILADGVYTWIPESNSENLHELTATFVGTPTAGTLSVRARPRNSADFITVDCATDMDLTEAVFARFTGNVEAYEFTVAGLVGATAIVITDLASDGDPTNWYGAFCLDDLIEVTAEGSKGLAVFVQDQTTPSIFVKANQVTNSTTLAVDAAIGDTSITVADTTGINLDDYLGIFSLDTDRFYVGNVLTLPGGNVITLDSPIDSEFSIGDTVGTGITNMAVDGSSTPQIFSLRGADPGIQVTVDITRIIFSVVTTSLVDLSKFANFAPLTKGLLMRRNDGVIQNIINWKDNAEIAGSMYDWTVLEKTNPVQGVDGFIARLTFGGQSKVGVVLRVGPGEEIEFIVQDDLATAQSTEVITSFEIMMEGHVVQ